MADHASPHRPLPESLTRFLSDPASQVIPLQAHAFARLDKPETTKRRSSPPNRAMRIFLAWALAYNVLGFAIIVLLWRSLG